MTPTLKKLLNDALKIANGKTRPDATPLAKKLTKERWDDLSVTDIQEGFAIGLAHLINIGRKDERRVPSAKVKRTPSQQRALEKWEKSSAEKQTAAIVKEAIGLPYQYEGSDGQQKRIHDFTDEDFEVNERRDAADKIAAEGRESFWAMGRRELHSAGVTYVHDLPSPAYKRLMSAYEKAFVRAMNDVAAQ